MRRSSRVIGSCLLGFVLGGCLVEEARQAADQIGTARYTDMVAQFGPPAETDQTFTGKHRATWKSSFTNEEGRVSTDRMILVFGNRGLLEKVTYEDGADEHHLINFFSGSFTCKERGNYPGGPAWEDSKRDNLTPDTVTERKSLRKTDHAGWKSRK